MAVHVAYFCSFIPILATAFNSTKVLVGLKNLTLFHRITGRLFTCTKPQCQKMDQSDFQISLSSSPGLLKVSSVRCSTLFIGLTGQQEHIQRQRDVYYALAQERTCSSHTLSSGYTHIQTYWLAQRNLSHARTHTDTMQ